MAKPRKKYFRIWAYVEEYDPNMAEKSTDVVKAECLATFGSLERAKDFLDSVTTLDPYQRLSEQGVTPSCTDDQHAGDIAA